MNKVTFTPCLKKKYSSDKDGIINIRVTEERKSKYFSLKISINENDWNFKKCEIKDKHKESDAIKKVIEEKINELKQIYKHTESIQEVKTNDKNSFLVFFRSQINFLVSRNKIGTSKNSQTCLTHLTTFTKKKGKTDLLFSEIDIEIVTDFETYLLNQNIAPNTSKKYVSVFGRIFNLAIKSRVFIPLANPFILFENTRLPVDKQKLEKKDVEAIFNVEIDENNILYNIRNYFLFQIFAQGLRVGDLLTLKWSNLLDGAINFYQLKTKKRHTIGLNEVIVLILKDFLPDRCQETVNEIYTFKIDKPYAMTYNTLKEKYNQISHENISKFIAGDKEAIELIENWKKALDLVREKLTMKLTIQIIQFAKIQSNKFIFGLLKEDDFKDVKFNAETTLTKFQYNQVSSKTTIYNKQLKRLQKACGFDLNFTSHLPRHTYTNMLIESSDRDIYVISRSLGHRRLAATESYVNELNTERVDKVVTDFTKQFDFM